MLPIKHRHVLPLPIAHRWLVCDDAGDVKSMERMAAMGDANGAAYDRVRDTQTCKVGLCPALAEATDTTRATDCLVEVYPPTCGNAKPWGGRFVAEGRDLSVHPPPNRARCRHRATVPTIGHVMRDPRRRASG